MESRLNLIGIVYNSRIRPAVQLAEQLAEKIGSLGRDVWVAASAQESVISEHGAGTDLLVTVGGDGTILRTARIAVALDIPILGVNMGQLGFMTELRGAEAMEKVPSYLNGDMRVEERATIEAVVSRGDGTETPTWALNELVMSRGAVARLIKVDARIDGRFFTRFRADGVIVATATGSTGYALAAGGPILEPRSKSLVLAAVSPHLCLSTPLVLEEDSEVELELGQGPDAMATMDGQVDIPLQAGAVVKVKRGVKVARFLRANPPGHFYATVAERLVLRT